MYTVYIIYSANLDRYYIGFTSDLMDTRLRKHLANHKEFTGKHADWTVVYTEEYNSKKVAIQRERQIKSWKSRFQIEKLVRSTE